MLTKYIEAVMKSAHYEIIEDEGTYWGELTGVQGVWARTGTLEQCREDLKEALEEWIVFRLRSRMDIPVVQGLDLNKVA